MGLDGVAILMEVEDAFDLEISDEAASKMFTPGDLIDYVVDHVKPASTEVCASHRAFNLVRRAFSDVLAIPRTDLRRWMPLEHVVPTRERRVRWAEIGESSGAEEWPELTLPTLVLWVLMLAVPASAFAIAIWITGLGVVPDAVGAVVALTLMIPLGIVAAWSTRPLKVCFSPSASTVDGLIRFVTAKNPGLVVDDTARWSRDRVTLVVRQIIADQLAITEFDDDDRFVEDLGLT